MSGEKRIPKLIRADLAALGAYPVHQSPETLDSSIPAESVVKLDANENPYGCSPAVRQALADYGRWHIYPDAAQTRLRQQLQSYTGADASRLIAANGSGELLDEILCLLLEPGDEVVNCVPTFDLYRFRTLINRGKLVNVTRDEGYAVRVKTVKAALSPHTKLIILANPNNPTGNLIPRKDILELAGTGVPLLVDEAYYEFSGETVLPLTERYPNLMVLRTFSKWTGLAGLRLGYGILPPDMVSYLLKIKMPYNVNAAAQVAVQASLQDIDNLRQSVQAIIAERARLFEQLKGLDWLKPYPSQANFIFCSVRRGKAGEIHRRLQEKGILVRYFDQPLLQDSLRISVGRPEQTEALMKALREMEG